MSVAGIRVSWATRLVLGVGASGFGVLLWVLLPEGVVAMNDDFGYLRSVVATIQHARPWTDDWLEPWNAGLSTLSAIVWRGTGSFSLAIQGVQAALATLAFGALAGLLRRRGMSWWLTGLISALLLTMPTMWGKWVEYTGVLFVLPCLLLALAAAEQGRWRWFVLVWLVALATRQSAAAWGALPLVAAWQRWRESGPRGLRTPLLVWAAGVVGYFVLLAFMNRTHAQGAVTAHVLENVRAARAMELAGIGALVFAGAVGLSSWAGTARLRFAPWWAWGATAVLVGWIGWGIEWHDRVYLEHDRYAGSGAIYLRALLIIAAIGWLTHRVRLRWLHCGGALAALVLVCLRRDVWDYYFIDLFVFGFFAGETVAPDAESPDRFWWMRRALWISAAVALAWWHGVSVVAFKSESDVRWASVVLVEKSLRSGALLVQEIRASPFGFVAWELFPASLRRRPDGATEGENFFDYLSEPSAEVELVSAAGWSRRYVGGRDNRPREVLARGEFPLLWKRAEFELVRFPAAPRSEPKRPLPTGFQRPVFPLDDGEWSAAIRAAR